VSLIEALAGQPEWYPEADELIGGCVEELFSLGLPKELALRAVQEVFRGLTKAYVRGNISCGDEHEWAYIALRAGRFADEVAAK